MNKLILGLLMQKKLTVYEIRAIIRQNFKDVCSDSLGAIQAAIKKLLADEMVVFSEFVEKSVNKKQYAITAKGRAALFEWLKTPADVSEAKNMEFGKIFFMGMLPKEERVRVLGETIAQLEMDLPFLEELQATIEATRENHADFEQQKKQLFEMWQAEPEYFSDVIGKFDDLAFYSTATLHYGMELIKFNIEWFKKLQKRDEER